MGSQPAVSAPASPALASIGKFSIFPDCLPMQSLTYDSVNMYASTWICTKTKELDRPTPARTISALSLGDGSSKRSHSVEHLEI